MKIIELVGLAGAGKTTLTKKLLACERGVLQGEDISLRRKEHLPVFLQQIPALLPAVLPHPGSRRLTWDEIKSLVYLRGWPPVLRRQSQGKAGILLLDQGPVFRLATLHGFGPEWLRQPVSAAWWQSLFDRWSNLLDVVIWLDAPDSVLQQRINTRAQKHLVKGKSPEESGQFLARHRAAYCRVLEGLTAGGGPKQITFDTSITPVDALLKAVLAECGTGSDRK